MEIYPLLGRAGILDADETSRDEDMEQACLVADEICMHRRKKNGERKGVIPLPDRALSEIPSDSSDYFAEAGRILDEEMGPGYGLCSIIPTHIVRRGDDKIPHYVPIHGNNHPVAFIPVGSREKFDQGFLVRKI